MPSFSCCGWDYARAEVVVVCFCFASFSSSAKRIAQRCRSYGKRVMRARVCVRSSKFTLEPTFAAEGSRGPHS